VVVDPLQRPIRGATVTLYASDPLLYRARSDERGLARLEGLPPAPYAVEVTALGFDTKFFAEVGSDDSPLFVKLERLGGLEVLVVDQSGEPAADATVLVAGSALWPARSVTTSREGRASIAGLARGFYDVRAERGSLVSDAEEGILLERGEVREVKLTLVEGTFVTVTVTDGEGDGAPGVPDADVALVEGGISPFPRYGRSDKKGIAHLGPIAGGSAIVSARAEGFVPSPAVPVEEGQNEVRVALVRGAKITGRVVDDRDFPVDGATLEVIGVDNKGMPILDSSGLSSFRADHFDFALSGAVPLLPAGELGVMPVIPDIPREFGPLTVTAQQGGGDPWLSRSDGTFVLTPVTPGSVQVIARHPAYLEGISEPLTLKPGGEGEVRIVLKRGGLLEGRVLEHDRTPVAGARVEVTAVSGLTHRITYTAEDGSFAFPSLPLDVIVSVARPEAPSHIVERFTIDVPPDARREIDIILRPLRHPVIIRVSDDRGYPLDGVEVKVTSLEPDEAMQTTLFTDDGGEAELGMARELPLRVVLLRREHGPVVAEIDPAPARIELVMEAALAAQGTVLGGRGRVDGATLVLTTPTGVQHARSDGDGDFRFDGLAPGPAQLLITAPGFVPLEREVSIDGDSRRAVDLGRFELKAGGSVRGVVVDERGDPIAGARVAVGRVPTYLPVGPLPLGVVATDSEGRFALADVEPGTIDIEAYKNGYERHAAEGITVHAGREAAGIRIELLEDLELDTGKDMPTAGLAVTLSEEWVRGRAAITIEHVPFGGEAQRAGILAGDRLAACNGVPPRSLEHARRLLSGPPTEDVVLTLERSPGMRWRMRVRRERFQR
jgi:hypothetical protein